MSDVYVNTDYNFTYKNADSSPLGGGGSVEPEASIFSASDPCKNDSSTKSAETLRKELEAVQNGQGVVGKLWNGFKNLIGIGLGTEKVEDKIEQYENGEISYEEALNSIESYEVKQEGAVDLIANTVTGVATAGLTVATGGLGAVVAGVAIGGAAKAGIKTLDRATNNVEGDALDVKQIAKDAITGAVDGAVSAATAGFIKAPVAGQAVKTAIKTGVIQGAKAGVISGAATGATQYVTEVAFEEDVDFNATDFLKVTAQNGIAGGIMGGVLGGATSGFRQKALNKQVKVSHDANLNNAVDNKTQSTDYLDNYNANNKDAQIPRGSAEYDATISKFEDLSKTSEELAVKFDSQLDEATEQVNQVFRDKKSVEVITARSKGQKSIFSKLAKKSLDGKNLPDTDACYDAIGDALGIRIQMKSLDADTSRDIVEKILKEKGINGSYDDFVRFATGDNSQALQDTFGDVSDTILSALKTRQSENVVSQLVEGIKSGKITITELNNYGDGITSYFSDAQIQEIADAYNFAVQKGFIKSDKAFEIVNKRSALTGNMDMDDSGALIMQSADGEAGAKVFQKTKGAEKASGYTSAQMNTKHTLSDGTIANAELQIRGTKVNSFADVEHIPYDIRTGKIQASDTKYSEIYKLIKGMEDTDYELYNAYLKDTYKFLRLQELGLVAENAHAPVISDYGFSNLSEDAMGLLDMKGLIKMAKHK